MVNPHRVEDNPAARNRTGVAAFGATEPALSLSKGSGQILRAGPPRWTAF
jgi:hypothetical protein